MKKVEIVRYFNIGAFLTLLTEMADQAETDLEIGSESIEVIDRRMLDVKTHLRAVDMKHTLKLTEYARTKLKGGGKTTWKEGKALFECIDVAARSELSDIFVGYIPPESAEYWEKDKPFGDQVELKFRSLKEEITSACNCYAIEEYTASVFHLMRIAELGLRELAKQHRIRLPKNRLIAYADWQEVINGLTKRADATEKKKRGPVREQALIFLRGAIADCAHFKEEYRHPLMHSRSKHTGPETLVVMTRVCEFVQRLASVTPTDTSS